MGRCCAAVWQMAYPTAADRNRHVTLFQRHGALGKLFQDNAGPL
jgi:hypothetical protein